MTDSIKITIASDEKPAGVHSQMDSWVASYTPSEPLRKAILKRSLLIAAFDERFVDKTIGDEDLRNLLHRVAHEMLTEPPVPLTAADSDEVLSATRESR
jgi:uncharacterized protein YeaO (DUF488 family)